MKFQGATIFAILMSVQAALASNEYSSELSNLADDTIESWAQDDTVISAVIAQNSNTSQLSDADILALDKTWRAQTETGGQMIDDILANDLSQYLRDLQTRGDGQFTEIFVTDIRGLNVGQSVLTSDYWQGDEDKWMVPKATGQGHVGEVEFDESTQSYQSQISLPIIHNGIFIGAITVGVDLEMIATRN